MLREPALVATHHRCDAQCKTFLAEQRVAAVPRSERPNFTALRKVNDVFVIFVAWPRHIGLALFERRAYRMHARHERTISPEHVVDSATHARHELHIDNDVGAVRELDADMRNVAAN